MADQILPTDQNPALPDCILSSYVAQTGDSHVTGLLPPSVGVDGGPTDWRLELNGKRYQAAAAGHCGAAPPAISGGGSGHSAIAAMSASGSPGSPPPKSVASY